MKSRTKQNCQFSGVTESNSTGIVLKAYKSARKIDAKCVIVCAYECAIYAHLKPSSKDSNTKIHLFFLFFRLLLHCSVRRMRTNKPFEYEEILSHFKKNSQFNGTYSSNICLSACLPGVHCAQSCVKKWIYRWNHLSLSSWEMLINNKQVALSAHARTHSLRNCSFPKINADNRQKEVEKYGDNNRLLHISHCRGKKSFFWKFSIFLSLSQKKISCNISLFIFRVWLFGWLFFSLLNSVLHAVIFKTSICILFTIQVYVVNLFTVLFTIPIPICKNNKLQANRNDDDDAADERWFATITVITVKK